MDPATLPPATRWKLPPLILHPFSDYQGPGKLVESSRASLILQGLLPQGDATRRQLDDALLEGRYCELRMLFYIGRDLVRWLEQCTELAARDAELTGRGIGRQSFVALLVNDPPEPVRQKLSKWGVTDFRAIFSRALGLNAVFAEAPERLALTDDFVRNYYKFADQLYLCSQGGSYAQFDSSECDFELFASGEYSRMLEREWERGA